MTVEELLAVMHEALDQLGLSHFVAFGMRARTQFVNVVPQSFLLCLHASHSRHVWLTRQVRAHPVASPPLLRKMGPGSCDL